MYHNKQPFQEMLIALEIFLQQKIEMIFRDQPEISRHISVLPQTWNTFFSSDMSPSAAILEIWKGLAEVQSTSITTLADRVENLGLTTSTVNGSIIGLAYIIK